MGTVSYMSPEQARGQEVDHRSDIFSLGVMLYEMIAGRRPFEGTTTSDVIAALLTSDPKPVSDLRPETPPELEQVLSRCLERSPEDRCWTSRELQADLNKLGHAKRYENQPETARKEAATRNGVGKIAVLDWLHRHVLAATFAGLALMASLAVISYFGARGEAIDSLAVLPFESGANATNDYLGDGITDSLINKLAQLPNLKVISSSSSFRFKGNPIDPREVGQALGVRAVLTGTVAQHGNSLIVRAELVRIADGVQIWGEKYNRQLADILLVQEDIARKIVEALHLKLTGAEQQQLARRYTENIDAYNLYLKGRYYERQFTEEHVKTGISYFRKAIEKDPNYALAYSGLADSYVALGTYYFLSPRDAFAEASRAAARAVELDQMLAEAYVSLAMVRLAYDWDWADYEKNVRRARELNPNYAKLYYTHSQYLAAMKRFEEAIAEARRAQEFETPLDISTNVGWIFYFARRYDQAIEQYLKAIDQEQDLFRPRRLLGLAYLQKRQPEQAITAIQQSVALSGGSLEEKAYLGYAYGVAGRRSEALKIMGELREQARRRYLSPYLMALVTLGLGDKDQTFAWLDRAYAVRSVNLVYLNVDPIFDSLRSDSRFIKLRQRVGLPTSN
jgi:serine/threonine-protein kinase